MLHFHFIPNASFFIAFLGHTHTHTHTRILKWQMAASSGTRASQFAALGSTVRLRSAQLESESKCKRARSITAWATLDRTEQKRNEMRRDGTRRDEKNTRYAIRETVNGKRDATHCSFCRCFRSPSSVFVRCVSSAKGGSWSDNSAQCRQFRFN